ncbi:MAG: DNA/RNA nuclease SfsA [Deltaproteobacteria bacterium HGW-Deltaproteobacteria-8]|jgi:sugar fermentation stimulation protein A|nr:MAG: DNA/RNA nuclease SfsA [Deltaproteobacteria bacterium HGW-Deltaproteobacteria-8]
MCSASARLLLPFPPGCRIARLVRREKRFTIVATDPQTGAELLAHTNNTGSMLGLLKPGTPALLSPALNPDRKLRWTLEALALPGTLPGDSGPALKWVGVNTQTPNRLLEAAFHAGLLPDAQGYARLVREATTGASRLDALLTPEEGSGLPPLYVECKNVTLVEDDQAQFPDAPSERGRKHLAELTRLVHEGSRAALFFLVQRPDGGCFAPAESVDPDYASALAVALAAGVEAWVWRASITGPGATAGISLAERLPLAPAWAALERSKEPSPA